MTGEELIAALTGALNRMDVDAFAALLSDDVIVEHVSTGRILRGKEEVIGWFQAMLEHAASNDVTVKRMCVDGSTIWAERVDRHLVGGRWIEIPIMGIVEFDSAGKMTLMRDYFDSRLAL
jgi:limonene-1,2-epoxide hydrolase